MKLRESIQATQRSQVFDKVSTQVQRLEAAQSTEKADVNEAIVVQVKPLQIHCQFNTRQIHNATIVGIEVDERLKISHRQDSGRLTDLIHDGAT